MRFLTEKKYRAMQEGHAFELECLNSDLSIVRSERDYYREARERANDSRQAAVSVAKDVSDKLVQAQDERDEAREERDEAIRYEEAANRNYLRCLENEGRHITELNEARSKRDAWAHKTIELGKELDAARAEVAEAHVAHNRVVFELQQARVESERLQRRNDVQAETIRLLQGETATLRNSVNYFIGAAQTANAERNEARAEAEHHKTLVAANQNIAANRYMEIEKLKGQLDAAEQELKIVRSSNSTLRDELIKPKSAEHGCQPACSACNAKQADAALDSLRTAR